MKKNVAIIMGGFSSEHDISIKSASIVYKYLNVEKFNLYKIHITKKSWYYSDNQNNKYHINKNNFSLTIQEKKINFDVVFNAIHGSPGENGILQAYFELLNIPHTSCDSYQSALTFNKRDLLSTLQAYNIKCATSYLLNLGDIIKTKDIVSKVGLPCFVKANKAGSSFGISKVYEENLLEIAIKKAFKEDDEIIIESFLDGTEVSVGVITYQGKITVLPITEIVSENDFFDYEAKYEGKSQEITPARITEVQKNKVNYLASFIYKKLKLKGFTRSEFIFIEDEPYLL